MVDKIQAKDCGYCCDRFKEEFTKRKCLQFFEGHYEICCLEISYCPWCTKRVPWWKEQLEDTLKQLMKETVNVAGSDQERVLMAKTEFDIENDSFEYCTKEKSLLECCVRLKHSMEFLSEWMEVIAHPDKHPSKSMRPEYIASQLESSTRVAVRVMDHIIKEIDKTSWCWDKRISKGKNERKD